MNDDRPTDDWPDVRGGAATPVMDAAALGACEQEVVRLAARIRELEAEVAHTRRQKENQKRRARRMTRRMTRRVEELEAWVNHLLDVYDDPHRIVEQVDPILRAASEARRQRPEQ